MIKCSKQQGTGQLPALCVCVCDMSLLSLQVNCEGELGEDTLGFGKRKRREVRHFTFTKIIPASDILASSPPYPPTPTPSLRVRRASQAHQPHKNTTSWERNLAIKVRIPGKVVSSIKLLSSTQKGDYVEIAYLFGYTLG